MPAIFEFTPAWKSAFPGAHAGVLVLQEVINPAHHAGLDQVMGELVDALRLRYAGRDRPSLLALPVLQAYHTYYAGFKKTYHVQLQLESILFKGKPIPGGAALVEAMFMAEVKNMLLTAGHDLDRLSLPVKLDVTRGDETYVLMRGESQQVKPGDMMISDSQGILSSIIYGPDQRSCILPETRNVLYTVYAPAGIETTTVADHLEQIEAYVRLFAPLAKTGMREVFG